MKKTRCMCAAEKKRDFTKPKGKKALKQTTTTTTTTYASNTSKDSEKPEKKNPQANKY